jgi:O-antigen ligase/tetratricopeptide (TPR) repeat protein
MFTRDDSGRFLACLCLGLLGVFLGYAIFNNESAEAWHICLVGVAVIAVVCLAWPAASAAAGPPPMSRCLAWAIVLFPCYTIFQLLPLPVFILRVFSPERVEILEGLRIIATPPSFAPLTTVPSATVEYLFNIAGYTLTFLVVRRLAWQLGRARNWMPVFCLIAIAALQAVWALFEAANSRSGIAHGSYVDRNHFAGLLEMAIPFTIAYALYAFGAHRHSSSVLSAVRAGAAVCAGVLLLTAVIGSLSKMGFFATLCGIFVFFSFAIVSRLRGWKRGVGVACLACALVTGFVFLPSDPLVGAVRETLSQGTRSDFEGRLQVWGDTEHLLREYPVFGTGLGTYSSVFPKFQTSSLDLSVPHAHNDFLEFATDLGLLGFLILAVIVGQVIWILAKAIPSLSRQTRYLALGCTAAMTAMLIHSTVEFNMQDSPNAMFLAWIAGIGASLPKATATQPAVSSRHWFPRGFALVLGVMLFVYSSAWILFETHFRNDPHAEKQFCQFGICDSDAFLSAQVPSGESQAAAPVPDLIEAVQREPASHIRWYYLCEAFTRSGNFDSAQKCFFYLLTLAPRIASEQLLAADFYAGLGDNERALNSASAVLRETPSYDRSVFNWFKKKGFTAIHTLPVLPPIARVYHSYLRWLISDDNLEDSAIVWDRLCSLRYADTSLANDYSQFLIRRKRYKAAAQAWAGFLGERRNGYLITNWIFNGDFESAPSGSPFDWKIEKTPGVQATFDPNAAHTGLYSLRLDFSGENNVSYDHVSQLLYASPGNYRFEAFMRTADVTTSKGVGFSISDFNGLLRLSLQTEQLAGTHDWTKLEQTIHIPEPTLLLVRVIREPVMLKFDANIKGTVWIDSVSLRKVP